MGPNGAGKSILLKLINGILEPSSGAILWNGNKNTSNLKRTQALIFQKFLSLLIETNLQKNALLILRYLNLLEIWTVTLRHI